MGCAVDIAGAMVCTRVRGSFVFPTLFLIMLNIYLRFWSELHIGLAFQETLIMRTFFFLFWVVINSLKPFIIRFGVLFHYFWLKKKNDTLFFLPLDLACVFLPTYQPFLQAIPVWSEDFSVPSEVCAQGAPQRVLCERGVWADCAFWTMVHNSVLGGS